MTKTEKVILIVLVAALALTALFWNNVRTLFGAKEAAVSEETIKKDKKDKDKDDDKDEKKKDKKHDKKDKDKTSSIYDLNDSPPFASITGR